MQQHIKICILLKQRKPRKKYYDSQLKPYEEKIKVSINHREKPKKYCLQCGKEITSDNRSNRKYCSVECFNISQRENVINKWLSGDLKINPNGKLPLTIRNYILEKNNFKCEECGFEGYNRKTGNTILQFHHKDGDSGNNNVDNIQLLCPNCHAMTENYMALNKGYSARNKRYK